MNKNILLVLFAAAAPTLCGCVSIQDPQKPYQPRTLPPGTVYEPDQSGTIIVLTPQPTYEYQQPYPYGYQRQPEQRYYDNRPRNFLGRTPYGETNSTVIEKQGNKTIIRKNPCTKLLFGC